MKASQIIKELDWCIKCLGDKDVWYLSRRNKGDKDEYVLYEQVNQVHATFVKIDKEYKPDNEDPITLIGCFGGKHFEEKVVRLNWFGRLIKMFIIDK